MNKVISNLGLYKAAFFSTLRLPTWSVTSIPDLTKTQQAKLLKLARLTLTEYLQVKQIPAYRMDDPVLNQPAGVFVTLWGHPPATDMAPGSAGPNGPSSGSLPPEVTLRGCIGHIAADTPLYQIVPRMAVAAATADTRLPSVTLEELNQIRIEISILSPLRPLTDKTQIQLGTHGVVLVHAGRHGLFLPEVPVERGWDQAEFLSYLCLKVGLSPACLADQPRLYTFTTTKFGE